MNRALQPETHPDAEDLSAFMEQALPDPERARVLTHLAECTSCRQVVFLSQQAVEAERIAVPVVRSADRPGMWSAHWRMSWRLVWAPAAALAMVVVLVVFIHLRRPARQTELARVSPSGQLPRAGRVPPSGQGGPRVSSPPEPATAETAHQSALVGAHKGAKKSSATTSAGEPVDEPVPPVASSGANGADTVAVGSSYSEPPGAGGKFTAAAPSPEAAPLPQPEPAVDAWKQEQQRVAGALSSAARTTHTTAARFMAKKVPTPANGLAAATATAPGGQDRRALAGNFAPSPPKVMAGAAAAPAAGTAKLPSGLAAESVASSADRMVAIDLNGALFVRENSGANWEPVLRQWTGRPVQVRVQRPVDSGPAAAPSVSAGTFEILNDHGQVWVSPDGRNWKPQEAPDPLPWR